MLFWSLHDFTQIWNGLKKTGSGVSAWSSGALSPAQMCQVRGLLVSNLKMFASWPKKKKLRTSQSLEFYMETCQTKIGLSVWSVILGSLKLPRFVLILSCSLFSEDCFFIVIVHHCQLNKVGSGKVYMLWCKCIGKSQVSAVPCFHLCSRPTMPDLHPQWHYNIGDLYVRPSQ